MLTNYQVSDSGAHVTDNTELYCERCADDQYTRSVSNFELDEWQSENGYAEYDADDTDLHKNCEDSVNCFGCGAELRQAYHDHPEGMEEE